VKRAAVLPLESLANVGKLLEAICYRPGGRNEHGGVAQSVVTADAEEQVTRIGRDPCDLAAPEHCPTASAFWNVHENPSCTRVIARFSLGCNPSQQDIRVNFG
jgi:hypothetical protein